MSHSQSKYKVNEQQMPQYLKSRFIFVSITYFTLTFMLLSVMAFILYKQHANDGLWSFLFSVPLIIGVVLLGIKRWHRKLRKLSDTEYLLTQRCLIQRTPGQTAKEIDLLKIGVIDPKRFGTTVLKGNWATKVNYYRPKRISYQLDDPDLIFIPSITTNYSELIDNIKQASRETVSS